MELPLGATEDRICGTIDIEKALGEGIKAYEPGLLVRAAAAAEAGVHLAASHSLDAGVCMMNITRRSTARLKSMSCNTKSGVPSGLQRGTPA